MKPCPFCGKPSDGNYCCEPDALYRAGRIPTSGCSCAWCEKARTVDRAMANQRIDARRAKAGRRG